MVVGVIVTVMLMVSTVANREHTYLGAYENVLGTSMELKVLATSDKASQEAEAAVLAEIDREARILSGYDPQSEFSRWFRTRDDARSVSPELFDVLDRFDQWRTRTDGALDASAETVSAVWKAAAAAGRLPTTAEIARATTDVRQPHWRLDRSARTATHLSAAPLVLNSFTKSYIVDRAARAGMSVGGVQGIVVNIGGDLVARGDWQERVSVIDPRADADNARPLTQIDISNRAVATSGVYRRGFDINGAHYSHIVDPRTGWPTGHVLSATVVAPDAADAGALATAFCVLTPEQSAALAAQVPNAEFMLVLADGSQIESRRWRESVARPATMTKLVSPVATLYAAEQNVWKPDMELTVSLEIVPHGFSPRPYLAVWVEDNSRFSVRTLALWYSPGHAKWLPELKSWYRSDGLRKASEAKEIIGSVSSATRGPGKYKLTWDGKDNLGRLVKAGSYSVYVEVAREHGTYQLMRQDVDFSGVPTKADLPANKEVSGVSFDYHRVAGK